MSKTFWVCLAAMLAAWLGMNLWSVPKIEAFAGGLRILDMRLTGYSFEEAHEFVFAIGDQGIEFYLGVQMWLDTVFPPLLGAVLFMCYRRLFGGSAGLLIGALAQTYVVVDLLENAAVIAMLRVGSVGMTPEMAAAANRWTTMKWSLALVGIAMLTIGLSRRFYRQRYAH